LLRDVFILAEARFSFLRRPAEEIMNPFAKLGCCAIFAVWLIPRLASQNQQAPPPQAQERNFDPMRAVHDVDVGKFYMKRGDLGGAIARFKDALLYKPHYAEACLLLGQAYEKSNDPGRAITYYQKYVKILPNTHESKKLRVRIAVLQEKIAKDKPASTSKNL
jgi:tetratricopeptide (TPR) repeat protein